MKASRSIYLIVVLLFAAMDILAQTVAIAHVSAKIVESVSVSSQAITDFDLSSKAAPPSEGNGNHGHVNLGKFKLYSGETIACNIMINSAALSDADRNEFTMKPSATNSGQSDAQSTKGNHTIHMIGKAHIMPGQVAGFYQGSYTMVFAYN